MRKSAFDPCCIPTRGTKVPEGAAWLHEIKHDGCRLIIQREGKRVRAFARAERDRSCIRNAAGRCNGSSRIKRRISPVCYRLRQRHHHRDDHDEGCGLTWQA